MAKCSCSLKLGIFHFPFCREKGEDVLELRFPDLVEFLTMKTQESNFSSGCPEFYMFPPAILPDEDLPHGFPSSLDNQTKENFEWLKKF